jgi:hypothetical protein
MIEKMILKKVYFVIITLLISSCSAQKIKKPLLETNVTPDTSLYFVDNTLELEVESKKILDSFGSALEEELFSSNKYDLFFHIISNEKEIVNDKYLYWKRIVYILDYLEVNYKIPRETFLIQVVETNNYQRGFIELAIVEKCSSNKTR